MHARLTGDECGGSVARNVRDQNSVQRAAVNNEAVHDQQQRTNEW